MEYICINDKYDSKTLEVFAKNKIRYPKEQEIVTVTRIHNYALRKRVGFFLKGYEGQYISDPISKAKNELSFSSDRFTHLDGTPILEEEIREIKKLIKV